MKVSYDKKVDALYIAFQPKNRRVQHTMRLKQFLNIDFGAKGQMCGIEILDASKHIPLKKTTAKK